MNFWSPLLDAQLAASTRADYRRAVDAFVTFVTSHGERVHTGHDLDYWLAYYIHDLWVSRDGRGRGEAEKALYGCEFWLAEFAPCLVARRCVRGWKRLVPPSPAAPMTRDLAHAAAGLACLKGETAAGLAMLVSFDCWLRTSEVSTLTADAVVDLRAQADPVGRGVAVYLPTTKTGRNQAVRIDDPGVAVLLVAWRDAAVRTHGDRAVLFPDQKRLRAVLADMLVLLGVTGPHAVRQPGVQDLAFVWHSFRHGGASRAHLAGMDMAAILERGRWAVEGSGRHYIQSGRQLLLSLGLPPAVATLARKVQVVGLARLLSADLQGALRRA